MLIPYQTPLYPYEGDYTYAGNKETFHRVNRIVLLLTAAASFVLPLCVITMHETVTIQAVPEVSIGEVQMTVAEEPTTPLWQIALPILYIIGMLAVLGHTLLSVWKVMRLIRQSEQHPEPDGTIVCVTGNAGVAPFSWMHYIVMNRGDYEAHDAAILAHERGHIRLRHSWDVLLVALLTALQWFNPAMWMLRQDLRAIHEYEADGAVLSQGINARQYPETSFYTSHCTGDNVFQTLYDSMAGHLHALRDCQIENLRMTQKRSLCLNI